MNATEKIARKKCQVGFKLTTSGLRGYVLNCWAAITARIKYSSKISVKYVYPSLSNMKLMHVRHLSFECFPHTNEKCILSLINKLELCQSFIYVILQCWIDPATFLLRFSSLLHNCCLILPNGLLWSQREDLVFKLKSQPNQAPSLSSLELLLRQVMVGQFFFSLFFLRKPTSSDSLCKTFETSPFFCKFEEKARERKSRKFSGTVLSRGHFSFFAYLVFLCWLSRDWKKVQISKTAEVQRRRFLFFFWQTEMSNQRPKTFQSWSVLIQWWGRTKFLYFHRMLCSMHV